MKVDGYSRDEFIRLSDVNKKIAEKYCDEHPKDIYNCDDFIAVYHELPELVQTSGSGSSMLWNEEMSNFDRIRKIFEEERYGRE